MAVAYINPEIIRWGRTRLDIPQQVVADMMHVNVDKYLSWETGEASPTINQAMDIGNILKIPFGYLYLSTPPEADKLPITDFRTIKDLRFQDASIDLRDMINIVLRQQEWYSAYNKEEGKFSSVLSDRSALQALYILLLQISERLWIGLKTSSPLFIPDLITSEPSLISARKRESRLSEVVLLETTLTAN